MHLNSRFACTNVLILLFVFCIVIESRQLRSDKKRDAEENEHHLLHILKDHEIIPDIIDDAPHADILEVRIFLSSHSTLFSNVKFNSN